MGIFPFGRKIDGGKGYSFQEIPLFSTLSAAEIRFLEKKFRLTEYKRGDIVYEEGKPADAFYVIVSGRFRVFQKSRGDEKTLIYLYRGDYFGESSLLTGQVHSASVEARSDGLLLRLDKEEFLKTLQQVPALSLHLSRTLGHRLTKIPGSEHKKREVKVAALYSLAPAEHTFLFMTDLATNLVRETKGRVIVVDFVSLEEGGISQDFKSSLTQPIVLSKVEVHQELDLKPFLVNGAGGFAYLAVHPENGEEGEKKLSRFLTFLVYRYDYIVIRLGHEIGGLSFKALKQSDLAYLLLDSDRISEEKTQGLARQWEQEYGFSANEIKILLSGSKVPEDLNVFQLLPSRSERPDQYHSAVRFVAKELAGTLVGLVLGSGAAYGLAHIGVLKVLEKENIPIDILAGSSMGALIAAFWAAGFRAADIEKITKGLDQRQAFFKLVGLRDLSLAHHGFLHGRQVTRFLESFLGDRTLQDLATPVKIVGTNLTSSRQIIFENGRVVDALRASISIPGIFRPLRWKGDLLIDGGILNPLPVDVLAKMGVKKIIAVNVLNGPEDRMQKTLSREEKRKKFFTRKSQQSSLWRRVLSPLLQRLNEHFADNIFNVIMNTIQFMEYEIAEVSRREADVLIEPIVHEAHWAEFYKPEKFIREGEKRTLEQMDEIKRLIAE